MDKRKQCGLLVSITLFVGLLIHIIGFSTTYWTNSSVVTFYHTGLWKTCLRIPVQCIPTPYTATWFKVTQAFEVIGVCTAILTFLLLLLYTFVSKTSNYKALFIASIVSVGIAAGSTILGIIIYGSNQSDLDWSFAFTVIGGIIYGVTGGIMVFLLLRS